MHITVDANEANVRERVGTGQYTNMLLSEWSKLKGYDFTLLLRDLPLPHLPPARSNWRYQVLSPRLAWTRLALPAYLLTHTKPHVFFNPAHYLPPYTGCPSVVTIHDLAYEFYPELFLPSDLYKLRHWTRQSVARATRVIAVSASTKRDLLKLYDVPDDKVEVVANGYDASLFNTSSKLSTTFLKTHGLTAGHYLLHIGTIQPRKNLPSLIRAFELIKKQGYQGKLVLSGKVGWLAEESLQAVKSSRARRDIVMTGYVSDAERAVLYRHAEVFVLPSLYEGFGVGVLEAMASGCPVATSSGSALPEVVGSAGILFDPHDPVSISASIRAAIKSREALVSQGLVWAKRFSWEKCAAETLKVLTS